MHDRISRNTVPLLFGFCLAAGAMGDARAQDATQDTPPAQSREKFGDPAQYEVRDLPVTLNPERDCLAGKAQPEAESKRKAA